MCQVRVSHKSIKQECLTRVLRNSVKQECPTRVSKTGVSCQGVPQLCQSVLPFSFNLRVSIRVCGFHLVFFCVACFYLGRPFLAPFSPNTIIITSFSLAHGNTAKSLPILVYASLFWIAQLIRSDVSLVVYLYPFVSLPAYRRICSTNYLPIHLSISPHIKTVKWYVQWDDRSSYPMEC